MYQPDTNEVEAVINELSTLLTAGRISDTNTQQIIAQYISREQEQGRSAALRLAQQLIIASPEYRTTGVARKAEGESRASKALQPNCSPYKAVVFLNASR